MGYYEKYSYVEEIDGKPMRFATETEAKEYKKERTEKDENNGRNS